MKRLALVLALLAAPALAQDAAGDGGGSAAALRSDADARRAEAIRQRADLVAWLPVAIPAMLIPPVFIIGFGIWATRRHERQANKAHDNPSP